MTRFTLQKLTAAIRQHKAIYSGGFAVVCAIVLFYSLSLTAIWQQGQDYSWHDLMQDRYLHHVIYFSFWQAFLSAILSILFGILFARAFFYQKFWGKKLILKLFSLTFVLPSLVVIFGLMGIYGQNGWFAHLYHCLGFVGEWDIYGLTGILIAHLFFNIPLASRLFLQSLSSIPSEQRQLAAQLGIRGWQFIRLIELPYLRQQLLPTFVLIFMLCFTSFAVVLTLGGGPKFTTLEVAIYQSVFFDFDLGKAAIFALLQFVFCFILFSGSSFFIKKGSLLQSQRRPWLDTQTFSVKFMQIVVILLTLAFILLPLINTIWAGLFSGELWHSLHDSELWRALIYSVTLPPLAGLLTVIIAMTILYLARYWMWRNHLWLANNFLNLGMVILAIPTLVLALGLFLLLRSFDATTPLLFSIVMCCNALMALPFVIRVLTVPMYNNMLFYEKLCNSLGIRGFARLRYIEWHNLKNPIKYGFTVATCLSLGDLTAISLFGNQDFTSLPQLLYQQLARYQMDSASVTALVLLIFCALLFYFVEEYDSASN